MKKVFLSLLILMAAAEYNAAYAQTGELCDAITTIMRDAPNKFRNIRGNVLDANANATTWDCGIKVPGVIGARFVASMGLFYEGAFYQSKEKDDTLKMVYEKYKALLTACLTAQGYTLSLNENFSAGLGDYKKLVFLPQVSADVKAGNGPPHVTVETLYNKYAGHYTIVMYIFEH